MGPHKEASWSVTTRPHQLMDIITMGHHHEIASVTMGHQGASIWALSNGHHHRIWCSHFIWHMRHQWQQRYKFLENSGVFPELISKKNSVTVWVDYSVSCYSEDSGFTKHCYNTSAVSFYCSMCFNNLPLKDQCYMYMYIISPTPPFIHKISLLSVCRN